MAIFVVTYEYLDEPQRLDACRPERYGFFRRLDEGGQLFASGQLLDEGLGEGMLLLEAGSLAQAEALLDEDPFVRAGLVARRRLVRWRPTVGSWLRT